MRKLTGEEWLLVALGVDRPNGAPPPELDRVRVMKSLFVLEKGVSDAVIDFYRFEPYNYGPFDVKVYRDAERLAQEELVEIKQTSYTSYTATEKGRARAKELAKEAFPEALQYLTAIREWIVSVDFSTLVKAIYQQWPDMKAKSVFQG